MKLHLPVRLFRAIVALMSLPPSVMYAAYVKPTEIVIPSSYTYVIEASSEDDVLQYSNDSSDIAFRLLDSLAFDSEAVMGSNAGKRLFSSNSSDSLASITINGSRLYTVEFTALNEVEFSQCNAYDSYRILGGAIRSDSQVLFNNNYKLTFVENTARCQRHSGFSDSTTWAYGGAIYASEVEIVDNAIVDFSLNAATAVDFRTNSYGGAIYASSEIKINGNSSVLFYSNAVNSMRTSGGYSLDAFGGAICSSGSVFLEENESVKFTENYAYSPQSYSGAGNWDSLVAGGAIFGDSICIQKNNDVCFSLNVAEVRPTLWISACGSAIYATNDVILFDNENLEFTENKTIASYMDDNSGAICAGQTIKLLKNRIVRFENNSIIGSGMGAACAAGTIYISDNKEVGLTHNKIDASLTTNSGFSEARGGAIKANNLFICDNETVFLKDNGILTIRAEYLQGGAVYITDSLSIRNNRYVCFESNYEQDSKNDIIYLRGLYVKNGNVLLSAPDNGAIEFKDSIYISSGAENKLDINSQYCNSQNEIFSQTGDIVFSSVNTENELYRIKGNIEGLPNEIEKSKTYCAYVQTNLYDGRLRIEDGAIFVGNGITVYSSASGESTPTLYLRNAELNHSGYDIKLSEGSVIEISNHNSATAAKLIMAANSSVIFHVTGENFYYSNLRLTGSIEQQGSLTLNISFNDTEAEAGLYKLMTVTSITDESLWTSSNVTVNGLDGYVVSFDDLEWKDNTLYLNYNGTPGTGDGSSITPPALLIATWTNEAQDGLWNGTSLNWEQEEVDYAYTDGVQVVFGDEGAGTVTLVEDIAPSSVLVNSAEDYTWNADATEGGKLTGGMSLTKKGKGTLIINTENDYTGGTQILGGTVVAGSATALGSGDVNLTNATLEITAEGISNALTTAGTSSILVQDDGLLTLKSAISNAASGILTLSGKVDVSGIGNLTKLDATLIDVNGNAGESGFARAEGYTLQVVNGGKVLGSGAELVHSGLPTGLTLVLGENGLAMAGAATDFTKYVVAGSHAVSVSEILKDVPTDSTLSCIEMSGGTLLVDAATDALSATSGTVTVTRDVELGGSMSGGMLLAQAGEIAATLSGSTGVVASGTVTLSGNNSHTGGVILNGGSLTLEHANALGTGQLVTNGNSSLIIDSGVELVLNQAISNSGTLSISGNIQAKGNLNTVAATRVDVNGNSGASGFAKDALEWVQIVNGGTTVNDGAVISHESATGSLVLGSDGRATGGGVVHYDKYLLTGTGVADVQSIKDAAGSELTGIRMEGGTLTVGTDTAGLLTATDGLIILEAGGKLGADSSISGVDIKATGGSIASTLTDSNTLEGIGNFALDATIGNNGTLVLSGTINADALSLVEEQAATFVDVNGNSGTSGFAQSALMSVHLTDGTGNTIDGGVTITHKDATGILVLGANGKAGYGGDVDYTHYLLNGIDDKASVSGIIADAGDALNTITVQQGTLTVDAVTKPVTAMGGAIVLDGGVLNGELTDTALTLKNGSLGTVSITGGAVTGDGYQLSSVLNLNGNVSISGSFNASVLQLDTTHATRIDVNNQSGASGFYQADAYMVQLINGGILSIADGTEVKHGSLNLVLGADGYATAGGGIIWSEYLLTGDDSATASAILQKANDNGYSGTVAINQTGGTLTVDTNAGVNTSTGNIILTGGTLSGTISGATINASAGTLSAALSGNNSLVGQNFALSEVLTNSGTLTLSGTFSVNSLTTNEAATYIGADGLSGFAKEAYKVATIAMGTTADAGATIKYGDETLKLNTDGTASLGGKVDYSTFWLQSDVSVASAAIHTMSSNALVDITSGHLTVNDETRINATGGSIELTTGGVLNGSLSNTELTLTAGTVNATISGGKVIGNDYALSEVLQVSGNVSISGSFVADNLVLNTIDEERIDVVTGNSGNSGFLLVGGHSVQIINGGTLDIASDTTITHGTLELTLGSNGFATTGRTMGHEYLLIGNDAVNVGAILAKDSSATINMQGGTLTVDAATNKLTATAGTINLNSSVELGGSISGATINASMGTLSAALSGNNSLVGQNFALSGVLTNSGTLTMSGTFSVNSLSTNEAATYIGADGLSGFAKEAYKVTTIAMGTTADAGATIKFGDETLKLNTDGTASLGGKVDYSTFWLQSDVSVASDAIHTMSSNALVDITSGHLTVNDETRVKATGGSIELTTGGVLNGSLSNTELTLTAGAVNATISGGKVMGNDYALREVLQVSGNVSISGSFNASALKLVTEGASRVDVVTGNSGNSGFLKQGDSYVQLINGGTLTIDSVIVSHQDAATTLTLGNDGYARSTGGINYNEYLLTGSDRVSTQLIHSGEGAGAIVRQEGGVLSVNDETKVTTTSGEIVLLASTLHGDVIDARVTAENGSIAATLSGITAVTITGEVSMSGNNSHSGVTTIADGKLTIAHANALGTGDISATGESSLIIGSGVTYNLTDVIDNNSTLIIGGNFDASALAKSDSADVYVDVLGNETADGSGFIRSGGFTVLVANGTVNSTAATVIYKGTELEMNGGIGSAKGGMLYGEYRILSGHEVSSSAIHGYHANSANATVIISGGTLNANDDVQVTATGGQINLSNGTISGSIIDTDVQSTADSTHGIIDATMAGNTSLVVGGGKITVSGANSYIGGTEVNAGVLVAGSNSAFGNGDIVVHDGGSLDLATYSTDNKVMMRGNSTFLHADGASHIVLETGSNAEFANGFTLTNGKNLTINEGGATYEGSLTLGGGTLCLSGMLTVDGGVDFLAGTQTTLDLSLWSGAGDGTVLANFGTNHNGYTEESLLLRGLAGEWMLDFNTSTGILTLMTYQKADFNPNLTQNQKNAYDTIKDIMDGTEPDGELGLLGNQINASCDEEELRALLDEIGGTEYATLMSSQIDGNLGHLRRLRERMGSGYMVVGSSNLRANAGAFSERSNVDGDTDGYGYDRSEWGVAMTLEYVAHENLALGIGIEQGDADLSADKGLQHKEDSTRADVYMVYNYGAFSGKTAVGVSFHNHDLQRNVLGNEVTASADGSALNFLQEVAWDIDLNETDNLQLFAAIESSLNKIEAFNESGAGTASLLVDEQDAWATDITVGARYATQFAMIDFAPKATFSADMGVVASVGDTKEDIRLQFAGAKGYQNTQSAANRNRWGFTIGAGLNMPMDNNVSLFISGDAILRGDSYELNANFGIQLTF